MSVFQLNLGTLIMWVSVTSIYAGRVMPITNGTSYSELYELHDRVEQLHRDIIVASNEGKNPEKVYDNKMFEQEYQTIHDYYTQHYQKFRQHTDEERREMFEKALRNVDYDLHGHKKIRPWMIDAWDRELNIQINRENNAGGQ